MAAYHDDWAGSEGRVRLVTIESGGHTVPQEAYRFPRFLGKTFPSDAVLETSWRFVRGEPDAPRAVAGRGAPLDPDQHARSAAAAGNARERVLPA